jgi:hypothetical protein
MNEKLNINDVTKDAIVELVSLAGFEKSEGLTVVQTAQYLNMSVVSLHQMSLRGKGPKSYKDGNRVLYKPSSIAEFIKEVNSKNKKSQRRAA